MQGRVKRRNFPEFYSNTDTLVRRGDHVIMVYEIIMYILLGKQLSNTGRCDFYKLRDNMMPRMNSMIVPKDSPLLYALSKRVMALTESGLYNFWLKSSIPNYSFCLNPPAKISISSSIAISNIWV
ncbi:uncharacterized protein LOC121856734 [Homarus americanus]|uniref:uncharacterized protein LOC121856734 n=1 Tax=Homarus americanus TaxID=6706 RepID=UPI001C44AFB9|nr:uncharacterized protein LOC121856734 [Homarus americanus]